MEKFFDEKICDPEICDKDRSDFISWLNSQWNLDLHKLRPDIEIKGSPERALSRGVVENCSGELFLVEQFSKSKFEIRNRVAHTIQYLIDNGLDLAVGYEATGANEFLPFFEGHCFGVTRFLGSTPLNRPEYLHSKQMGNSFANFIRQMTRASVKIEQTLCLDTFSIKDYIYTLFDQMKQHDPDAYDRFSVFLVFLEKRFMDGHDQLPVAFCHGDLHPLNVIWNYDEIKAVIDWEFIGIKPQIYDAANLVGCAGIENPQGLALPMVTHFLKHLKEQNSFEPSGWKLFPEYILALRFAWLSEWLRKKDHEMLEMEEAFMQILVDNMDVLREGWGVE